MKKTLLPLALASLICLAPAAPLWAGHDMSGMNMSGSSSIMLENVTQDGVAAMAHLNDIHEAMAKSGRPQTHHLMVMFTDAATGKPITEGAAAVKVTGPDGKQGEALKMMLMGDGFGTDVTVATPGKYSFEVGTKLTDGKRRVFTFNYTK